MEENFKKIIDLQIEKLLEEKEKFEIQGKAVIGIMKMDSELVDALKFYEKVFNKILASEKVSYKKKLHFLSLHKISSKIANDYFNQ